MRGSNAGNVQVIRVPPTSFSLGLFMNYNRYEKDNAGGWWCWFTITSQASTKRERLFGYNYAGCQQCAACYWYHQTWFAYTGYQYPWTWWPWNLRGNKATMCMIVCRLCCSPPGSKKKTRWAAVKLMLTLKNQFRRFHSCVKLNL